MAVASGLSWLLLLGGIVTIECTVESPKLEETNVKINVPNPLNFMPDLSKLTKYMKPKPPLGSKAHSLHKVEETISSYLEHARNDYKHLRESVQSVLNLNGGRKDAFSLDLQQSGPRSNLNVHTLLADVSVDTNKQPLEESSTEVPFNEYLQNLIEEQGTTIAPQHDGDYSPSDFDSDHQELSQYQNVDISRTGDMVPEDDEVEVSVGDSEEYDELLKQEAMNYLRIAGLDENTNFASRSGEMFRSEDQMWFNQPQARDYVVNMLTTPESSEPHEHSYAEYAVSHGEDETYNEYIRDVENEHGPLSEHSRMRIKNAFRDLKNTLESVDIYSESCKMSDGNPLDCETANFYSSYPSESADPSGRIVLAFAISGVPLKLVLDPEIENPIEYLHEVLSEAGFSLNIPVSADDLQPVGTEIIHVGACNRNEVLQPADVPIVSELEELKSFVDQAEN